MRITVLAGGVGAARFLDGLSRETRRKDVTVIGNTGDDLELYGLHISPDLDTVTYTLAEAVDPETGWGRAGETWTVMEELDRYGGQHVQLSPLCRRALDVHAQRYDQGFRADPP